MDARRKQSSLTRDEWIRWCWLDVTWLGDSERMVIKGLERSISDALEAGREFDAYQDACLATDLNED